MGVQAVVGVSTFGKNDPFHFGNLGVAFLTLLRVLTMDSWSVIMYWNIWGCEVYLILETVGQQEKCTRLIVCAVPWANATDVT